MQGQAGGGTQNKSQRTQLPMQHTNEHTYTFTELEKNTLAEDPDLDKINLLIDIIRVCGEPFRIASGLTEKKGRATSTMPSSKPSTPFSQPSIATFSTRPKKKSTSSPPKDQGLLFSATLPAGCIKYMLTFAWTMSRSISFM